FTLGLDAVVLTCMAVLINAAALGEFCLAAFVTPPDGAWTEYVSEGVTSS
ncbi:hypothetical protein Tco_0560215, partial [Tanacetum coccineum]